MSLKSAIRAEAEALQAIFTEAGAAPIDAPMLINADTLLDLYGEDIRGRAFTTHDPDRGELMLRPDFTVPVVEMHMAGGKDPARYTYLGEVFRMQAAGSNRPTEYLQVGYELFDQAAPLDADAEVFALMTRALSGVPIRAVTGDIGIILATIEALTTTQARKAMLRRHVWRPRRFRALLDRFTGTAPPSQGRAEYLLQAEDRGLPALIDAAGPAIGLRSTEEMSDRLQRLRDEVEADPIDAMEAEVMREVLTLKAPLPAACDALRNYAVDLPGLRPAVERLALRNRALAQAGVDVDRLAFEASYGRTQMEYYDGFVFGLLAEQPGLAPLATGGRYDALTRQLGNGRESPAVGGVIRPEMVTHLKEGLG